MKGINGPINGHSISTNSAYPVVFQNSSYKRQSGNISVYIVENQTGCIPEDRKLRVRV